MTKKEWESVRFFTPLENWGNPGLMFSGLVNELDLMRGHLGMRIFISCGTQGEHTKDSWHYRGRAVDIIVPETGDLGLLDVLFESFRFGFTGIGLYRDWMYNGKRTGGLHLEMAPAQPIRKLWLCTNESGVQVYYPLSQATLSKYKII